MNKVVVAIQKAFANIVSAPIPNRGLRRKVRNALNPLNPKRCTKYIARNYLNCAVSGGASSLSPKEGGAVDSFVRNGGEVIWQCWLQGVENAPAIVRRCLASVEKYRNENQRVVVITSGNFADYVTLPPAIIKKWRDGRICHAHFSDILRLGLLDSYGGYWIDATCLMTTSFPEIVQSAPFFIYHSHGEFSYTLVQNCFIHATPHHYMVRRWLEVMEAFWEKEEEAIHYFQAHLMFIALLQNDEEFSKQYNQMPQLSEEATHVLFKALANGEKYDRGMVEKATADSFIHKLTYKIPQDHLGNPDSLAYHLVNAGK